ncbi:MAG: copper resistance system multicopper oxidase [Gemmatimonas sp.]
MSDRRLPPSSNALDRRDFVRIAGSASLAVGLNALLPAYARGISGTRTLPPVLAGSAAVHDLRIAQTRLRIDGRRANAVTINGTIPGPLLRMREGEDVVIRVRNELREDTSIHWHGLLVPPEMDGVPGVSFAGIHPATTFEYRFPVRQHGTYWYHSHSGFQEQLGHYGPIVIEPKAGYPFKFDREYFVVLSDWTFENPHKVLDRLKKQGSYYNRQRRTLVDLARDASRGGLKAAIQDRMMWSGMRMDPTDILDVTGSTYTYLMNGLDPMSNWTGQFNPGERVLLHFINAAAGTYFDVRLPDLPMSVVEVSGQFVEPVETDEFRIAIAETYSVVVEPKDRAYTIFAETMDRSGFARGTLTPRSGMTAAIPPRRKRALLGMADMGMSHGGMNHANMGHDMPAEPKAPASDAHAGHVMPTAAPTEDSVSIAVAGASRTSGLRAPGTLSGMVSHESNKHGVGNAMVPDMLMNRLGEAGTGLGDDGWRVLRYTDLRSPTQRTDSKVPDREIEIHLTGNMERFMWAINGEGFDQVPHIKVNHRERIRLTIANDTMMNHPMHLHGVFMELENGEGDRAPLIHTVNVKPAERLSLIFDATEPGKWAFHCHLLNHMEVGMFRVVEVSEPGKPFPPSELQHVR